MWQRCRLLIPSLYQCVPNASFLWPAHSNENIRAPNWNKPKVVLGFGESVRLSEKLSAGHEKNMTNALLPSLEVVRLFVQTQ